MLIGKVVMPDGHDRSLLNERIARASFLDMFCFDC